MKRSPDKLMRKFLGIGEDFDSMIGQEPTYIGFSLKFDFSNTIYTNDLGIIVGGLLLNDDNLYSAHNYLMRSGRPKHANYITEFKKQLYDVQENKPWYFQSISGLEELWKKPQSSLAAKDKVITVECLETINLQMTFIADLYNRASYDLKWHRILLPDEKKWFNCKIVVAEVRNLYKVKEIIEEIKDSVNTKSSEFNLDDKGSWFSSIKNYTNDILESTNSTISDADVYSNNKLNEVSKKNIPVDKNASINQIDWSGIDKYTNTLDETKNDPGKAWENLKNNTGDSLFKEDGNEVKEDEPNTTYNVFSNDGPKTLDYSDDFIKNKLESLDDYISVLEFNLIDCEFKFDYLPYLETLSNGPIPESAKFKFDIIPGAFERSGRYGYFQWITKPNANDNASAMTKYTDSSSVMKDYETEHIPQYKSTLMANIDEQYLVSTQKKEEELKKQDTAVDNSFFAKAKRYGGSKAQAEYNKLSGNLKNKINTEVNNAIQSATNYLNKLENDVNEYKFKTINDAKNNINNIGKKNKTTDDYLKKAVDELNSITAGDIEKLTEDTLKQLKERTVNSGKKIGENIYDDIVYETKNIQQIEFDKIEPTNTLSNLEFEKPDYINVITPVEFEKTEPLKTVTPISFEKTEPIKDVTPISFEKTEPIKDVTSISFEKTEPVKTVTPIGFEKTEPVKTVTPIGFEKTEPIKDVTDIDFEKTEPIKDVTDIDFIKTEPLKKITPVKFIKTEPLKKITPVNFTGNSKNN